MKIIRFLGGLGNQMFQYAFYKSMEKIDPNVKVDLINYKIDKSHNGYELEDIFNLKIKKASSFTAAIYDIENRKSLPRKIRKYLNLGRFYRAEQKYFTFDPSFLLSSGTGYYYGFWQNEQYFLNIANEIRKDFIFKPLKDQTNIDTLQKINRTASVSIHVRRGDYIDHPSLGGLCGISYYQDAIQLIKMRIDNPIFFVFSNDIDWCKENLPIENAEYISWNKGKSSYIDMQLMSSCKHNIIANSSFSWWAAWLNNNPDKIVIGPKKWLQEESYDTSTLLPQGWIRL